jgi:hypothetical protein
MHLKTQIQILALVFISASGFSQNVGIGNRNPGFKLDVSGRIRLRGGGDNNNSAGLWFSGVGADSANEKIFLGMQADSTAGFYSNKMNVGWGFVFDGRNGNIGIGNSDPSFPVSFKDLSGDKISLYREGSNYYGLGVGNGSMQLMTPHNSSDIVIGYGRSAVFTENMRIKGNGRVGIGTTNPNATIEAKSNITGIPILRLSGVNEAYQDFYPLGTSGGRYGWLGFSASEPDKFFLYNDRNGDMGFITGGGERILLKNNGNVGIGVSDPAYKLDIGGRMRIRGGGNASSSAGIWLNNNTNSSIPAFVGMQSDNQVGFYGSNGAGWGLAMNTQNGAVAFGGQTGNSGDLLVSSGNSAAPIWQSLGNNMPFLQSSQQLRMDGTIKNFSNINLSFTLTRNARVLLWFTAGIVNIGNCILGSCPFTGRIVPTINGSAPNYYEFATTFFAGNIASDARSFGPVVYVLGPGSHNISFNASSYQGGVFDLTIIGSILVIPL